MLDVHEHKRHRHRCTHHRRHRAADHLALTQLDRAIQRAFLGPQECPPSSAKSAHSDSRPAGSTARRADVGRRLRQRRHRVRRRHRWRRSRCRQRSPARLRLRASGRGGAHAGFWAPTFSHRESPRPAWRRALASDADRAVSCPSDLVESALPARSFELISDEREHVARTSFDVEMGHDIDHEHRPALVAASPP